MHSYASAPLLSTYLVGNEENFDFYLTKYELCAT